MAYDPASDECAEYGGNLERLIIGGNGTVQAVQLSRMSNRHGLVTGATGTGKTVTLQVLAEAFSRAGVPVFAADVKGDLSGISAAGKPHKEVDRRKGLANITEHSQRGYPTLFWDIFGERGHPVRTTISEMGPHILSTLLELNETQSGVLYACFALADDEGMLLLDLKDLRSLLAFMSENADELRKTYGNISAASVGAIQRRLLVLEEQGADRFFGEPALDLKDLMRKDFSGLGIISVLDSDRLLRDSPRLYAAFLLWLLSELFEELPEAGDLDRPKVVLFFDEAHLLFNGMPKSLLDKIEQVVRLIRSKGVGVYLVTQNPTDVPQTVLSQLGLKASVQAVVDALHVDVMTIVPLLLMVPLGATLWHGLAVVLGATPGQRAAELRLVTTTGAAPAKARLVLRAVVQGLSIGLFLCGPAFAFFLDGQRRGPGDVVARTVAVRHDPSTALKG